MNTCTFLKYGNVAHPLSALLELRSTLYPPVREERGELCRRLRVDVAVVALALPPRAPRDHDPTRVRLVDIREEVGLKLWRDVFGDLERHHPLRLLDGVVGRGQVGVAHHPFALALNVRHPVVRAVPPDPGRLDRTFVPADSRPKFGDGRAVE
eukprot:CAMPEP_0119353356 /NCGR_PEP_ID=MMETSP1334-20130426/2523_1 /TAXON_ID=127549 /ORGANISM="Calcidiscus leptoporus, Strain RCC1130" /LENGTH=152 /DNA_ID=CAMNT_0007366619 /DNA_START=76 /DNA_END=533 /DNA_ORIENTATION=+